MVTEEYKGFTLKVKGEQGNGEYGTPLTNTPYWGEAYKGNKLMYHTYIKFSSVEYTLNFLKENIK